MPAPHQAVPFAIAVEEATLQRIHDRLGDAAIGYAPVEDHWQYGTSAQYLLELVQYWRSEYDWRKAEATLNRLPHFRVQVDDIDVHFIHVKGSGDHSRALILTHGWPGSFIEFRDVIERLAHPERFGGKACDAFDIVVPSLPGYGFSSRPAAPIGPRRVAALWRRLMVDVLGYERFCAQGGDWGAAVTCWLGSDHADVVEAIHVNLLLGSLPDDEAPETIAWRSKLEAVRQAEGGYSLEQSTFPQTIGLALHASPVSFAAWVIEKFQRWGDTGGHIESRFDKDTLITNLMIYLVNDAVISSLWMYHGAAMEPPRYASRIDVPTGVASFPGEFLPLPPRSTVERLVNLQSWTEMRSGGHFAALEEPVAFAEEVSNFFASVRREGANAGA